MPFHVAPETRVPSLPSYLEVARLFGWATASFNLRLVRALIDAVAPGDRPRAPRRAPSRVN